MEKIIQKVTKYDDTVLSEGIVLLAKQSGISSFSALWQVKNALGTKKIGHTGTLDTFAEGLLVVLIGKYTRLADYITDSDKEYLAKIIFGSETDTLDPDGLLLKKEKLPLLEDLLLSISQFSGKIQQVPPQYSAVHIDGKRASDRVRNGEIIVVPPREVTIHQLEVRQALTHDGSLAQKGDEVVSCIVRIKCSKGTYVRSLARDIAYAAGSCALVGALRRTQIGPFSLENACGTDLLFPFGDPPRFTYAVGEKPPQVEPHIIKNSVLQLHKTMASLIGLSCVQIKKEFLSDFQKGKKIESFWFNDSITSPSMVFLETYFCGLVVYRSGKITYGFVAGES